MHFPLFVFAVSTAPMPLDFETSGVIFRIPYLYIFLTISSSVWSSMVRAIFWMAGSSFSIILSCIRNVLNSVWLKEPWFCFFTAVVRSYRKATASILIFIIVFSLGIDRSYSAYLLLFSMKVRDGCGSYAIFVISCLPSMVCGRLTVSLNLSIAAFFKPDEDFFWGVIS